MKECVKLLRATIPAMVDISCNLDPDCAPVLADPTQIHQVIMNLCTNAWQALPKNSGYIRVDLEMCDIEESLAARHPGLAAGPAVRLSISDNGSGIDKATLERIFEPFFTTKPVGKGSGLGLSVVHGIVKSHRGVITVESEPGKGTVFHVYLPPRQTRRTRPPAKTKRSVAETTSVSCSWTMTSSPDAPPKKFSAAWATASPGSRRPWMPWLNSAETLSISTSS